MTHAKEGLELVRLWADQSNEARLLEECFRARGYDVQSMFSGSTQPLAAYRGALVSGYTRIRTSFSLPGNAPGHALSPT